MKTNLIIVTFVIALSGLAVYVYAAYPLQDNDRVNLQQLQKQQENQLKKIKETSLKYQKGSSDNEILEQATINEVIISIKDGKFEPNEITVSTGTTVIWENNDVVAHQVSTSKDTTVKIDSLESSLMRQGDQYSYELTTPGVVNYHCDYYPSMNGSIKVVSE